MSNLNLQHWRLDVDAEGITWAVLDKAGESANSLSRAVIPSVSHAGFPLISAFTVSPTTVSFTWFHSPAFTRPALLAFGKRIRFTSSPCLRFT